MSLAIINNKDILNEIFQYLPVTSFMNVSKVCKSWHACLNKLFSQFIKPRLPINLYSFFLPEKQDINLQTFVKEIIEYACLAEITKKNVMKSLNDEHHPLAKRIENTMHHVQTQLCKTYPKFNVVKHINTQK